MIVDEGQVWQNNVLRFGITNAMGDHALELRVRA